MVVAEQGGVSIHLEGRDRDRGARRPDLGLATRRSWRPTFLNCGGTASRLNSNVNQDSNSGETKCLPQMSAPGLTRWLTALNAKSGVIRAMLLI